MAGMDIYTLTIYIYKNITTGPLLYHASARSSIEGNIHVAAKDWTKSSLGILFYK